MEASGKVHRAFFEKKKIHIALKLLTKMPLYKGYMLVKPTE